MAIWNPCRKGDLLGDTTKNKTKTIGTRIFIFTQLIVGYSGRVNWCIGSFNTWCKKLQRRGGGKVFLKRGPLYLVCSMYFEMIFCPVRAYQVWVSKDDLNSYRCLLCIFYTWNQRLRQLFASFLYRTPELRVRTNGNMVARLMLRGVCCAGLVFLGCKKRFFAYCYKQ